MLYREFGLKELLEGMDEDEQLRMLSGNGMLVKRPVLVGENLVLVGFANRTGKRCLMGRTAQQRPERLGLSALAVRRPADSNNLKKGA